MFQLFILCTFSNTVGQWINPTDVFSSNPNIFQNVFPNAMPFFQTQPQSQQPQQQQPVIEEPKQPTPKNETVEEKPKEQKKELNHEEKKEKGYVPSCLYDYDDDSFASFRAKYPSKYSKRERSYDDDDFPRKSPRRYTRTDYHRDNYYDSYERTRYERPTPRFSSRYASKTTPFYSALMSSSAFPSTPSLSDKELRLIEKKTQSRLSCLADCADEYEDCLDQIREMDREKPKSTALLSKSELSELAGDGNFSMDGNSSTVAGLAGDVDGRKSANGTGMIENGDKSVSMRNSTEVKATGMINESDKGSEKEDKAEIRGGNEKEIGKDTIQEEGKGDDDDDEQATKQPLSFSSYEREPRIRSPFQKKKEKPTGRSRNSSFKEQTERERRAMRKERDDLTEEEQPMSRGGCRERQKKCSKRCEDNEEEDALSVCEMMKTAANKACEDQYDDRMTIGLLYSKRSADYAAERERKERRDLRRCNAAVNDAYDECLLGIGKH
ncbi:uncharacterized protein MONOS_6187 [Monocercomonoides exilis]|uniref:uncharacterized protein n=1 Tax=Monocercomonoides exilis TaxID=2049356 RepID=UPI00355A2D9B|nr:hypothetical protein MONOS_6187 [Monocercomonoides exilis]|eukprot:MONOS_6187.1-p1 / transcript=MONOS_6187.1 / gene=MONOS_6187 / organism=Monocercomonoides_exilis_PA203 / gene_product=unspecified product / transcript_product=unspecified product / location=Mono_scaffold00191:87235-89190(-) / protein_length=496 / sequence_SO=supercontig / SO=protein_coding / is_pseudo=false